MNNEILRIGDVVKITKMSRSTIYRWVANNQFPKYIKLSTTSTGWYAREVEAWLDSKIQARDAEV